VCGKEIGCRFDCASKVPSLPTCRTFAADAVAPASLARLQSRQHPTQTGGTGADQGPVADGLEGKADQDWPID
jgi:hypothetical protein